MKFYGATAKYNWVYTLTTLSTQSNAHVLLFPVFTKDTPEFNLHYWLLPVESSTKRPKTKQST